MSSKKYVLFHVGRVYIESILILTISYQTDSFLFSLINQQFTTTSKQK